MSSAVVVHSSERIWKAEVSQRGEREPANILIDVRKFSDQRWNDGSVAQLTQKFYKLRAGVAIRTSDELVHKPRDDGCARRAWPMIRILKRHRIAITYGRNPLVQI